MKKLMIYMLALLGMGNVSAQEAYNFATYREKVLDYSQQLKQSKLDVETSTYQRKSIKTGYLPRLDFSADASYGFVKTYFAGAALDPFNYSVGLNLTQNIYVGGAVSSQSKVAKIGEEVAQLSEQLTVDQILYQAEVVYWQAAANKQLLANAETYYNVVKELFDVVNKRFDDGYVSKSDLLMVNTRMMEAELLLNNSRRSASVAIRNLNTLVGIDVESPTTVVDDINMLLPPLERIDMDSVKSIRPDYLMLERNIAKQEQLVDVVRSEFNPQIYGGVKGGWGTPMINVDGKPVWNSNVYVAVRIPILQWGDRKYNVRSAKNEVAKLENQKSLLEDNISKETSVAWVNLNDNYKQIQIARQTLSIAEQNMELNTLRYNEGQLPVIDVLSSQLSWIDAYNNTVQAEYAFKVAYADYKRSTGVMQ